MARSIEEWVAEAQKQDRDFWKVGGPMLGALMPYQKDYLRRIEVEAKWEQKFWAAGFEDFARHLIKIRRVCCETQFTFEQACALVLNNLSRTQTPSEPFTHSTTIEDTKDAEDAHKTANSRRLPAGRK